ncbi:MAG: TonB-dependent receptor [Pseudomonadota bacterium]
MKRLLTTGPVVFILLLILTITPAAAEIETKLDFSAGYRIDQLDWNIAGVHDSRVVNVLSELTWEDLEIYQGVLGFDALADSRFTCQAYIGYGKVMGGKNQDSDYDGDDRTAEFSRSNNSADDGHVTDWSVAAGYRFRPGQGRFTVTPLFGYSEHKQALTMTDGFQTVDTEDPPELGSFPGLHTSYEANWEGMWGGVEMTYVVKDRLSLFGRLELHLADYYAEADWNLRTEFDHPKSFTHDSDGTGVVLNAGLYYTIDNSWSAAFIVNYQKWATDSGIDRIYYADGSQAETTLNEVNWSSQAITLRMTYTFPKEEEF